jgi:biotin carboxyl carrier protein
MSPTADDNPATADLHDTLTYHDAHMVLALLQGWKEGTVSLRYGDLVVEAIVAEDTVAQSPGRQHTPVRSPAVGVLTVHATQGQRLSKGDVIGVVDAPGRSTPVIAPGDGTLAQLIASNKAFVEYDEQIFSLEPITRE